MLIASMLHRLLDLLFPKHSLSGAEGTWITDEERTRMKLYPIRLDKQLLKKREIHSLDSLVAAGSYESSPLLRKAIKSFKYGRVRALGPELASCIVRCLPGLLLLPQENGKTITPVLCPVPLHWTRVFERGFNQANILAKEIAKQKHWHVQELLKRSRRTGHQAWRKRAERLVAMHDAFVCIENNPPPCVILIDDISSTGATLDSCAEALKKAGVKHVTALVIAYG